MKPTVQYDIRQINQSNSLITNRLLRSPLMHQVRRQWPNENAINIFLLFRPKVVEIHCRKVQFSLVNRRLFCILYNIHLQISLYLTNVVSDHVLRVALSPDIHLLMFLSDIRFPLSGHVSSYAADFYNSIGFSV